MKATRIFSMFILFSLFCSMSSLFASCRMIGGTNGDGNVLKETRKVGSFHAIEVSGAFEVLIKQGDGEEVTIETDRNILPLVRTEVEGSTLKIETRKNVYHTTVLKVYVTVKELNKIELSGAVNVKTDGKLTVPELSIEGSGASEAKMDIAVEKLKLDCSGASKLKFNGTAGDVNMELSGASEIFGFDLAAGNFDIEISGAGNAQINVSKKLHAEISGAGSVRYKGTPTEVDQSISGAGSIKKVQ
ncbi:MAG: head GIN domain-containing protein [Bacteroidota bacterium]